MFGQELQIRWPSRAIAGQRQLSCIRCPGSFGDLQSGQFRGAKPAQCYNDGVFCMRVALVSDWFLPRTGGLELQMRDLALQLVRRGHQVEIITGTPGDSSIDGITVHRVDVGPLVPRLFFHGQELHQLERLSIWQLLSEWNACWNGWLIQPLERILTERRFDVVHGHSAYSPLALAACRLARKRQIPSLLSEHSVSKGLGSALLRTAESIWRWSSWPDIITGVSTYVANELKALTNRDIEILPNGVDPNEWVTNREPRLQRVVSVMRLTRRKRGIDIVRSIPKVNRLLRSNAPVPFMLVGDGPERPRIKRESMRLGLGNQLELPGRLDRSDIRLALADSSVFILPTVKEALSIAVLEALCAGLPIVAMRHGGVGDIVEHGREGFLAKNRNEFCHYIAQLLSNPGLRNAMAARTRASAARFSWDIVVEQHLEFYQRALKVSGKAPAPEHAS